MIKNRKRKGFTLIELVIVIAIIGILVAIAVPRFSSSTEKARNTKVEANARTLASAVSAYYAENAAWPASADFSTVIKTAGVSDKYTIVSADAKAIIIKAAESYSGKAKNAYTDAPTIADDGKITGTLATGAAVENVWFVF